LAFIRAQLCRYGLSQHLTPAPLQAGAGGARNLVISIKISWNICRDTGRVAEGNFTPPPSRNRT
jgi:hypothetical protein